MKVSTEKRLTHSTPRTYKSCYKLVQISQRPKKLIALTSSLEEVFYFKRERVLWKNMQREAA